MINDLLSEVPESFGCPFCDQQIIRRLEDYPSATFDSGVSYVTCLGTYNQPMHYEYACSEHDETLLAMHELARCVKTHLHPSKDYIRKELGNTMRTQFLSEPDDIQWLRDVHLPKDVPPFKSAIIVGNEDCPERIELYADANPHFQDKPIFVYKP